jgi:hypothetical protein
VQRMVGVSATFSDECRIAGERLLGHIGTHELHGSSEGAGVAGDEEPGEGVCGARAVDGSRWLKRLIIRELRAATEAGSSGSVDPVRLPGEADRGSSSGGKRVYVRLCLEDWLLLEARAAARGLRPATYLAVLARSHLRSLAPLPKNEYLALMRSIAELSAIGRNINQIAHAANSGRPIPDSVAAEFRAMVKVCEALRDNTKALLKANLTSWRTGHVE